jgi:transposase
MKRNTVWTIGMDLGDKKDTVCVLNEEGDVVERLAIANHAPAVSSFHDRFENPEQVRVVMESGTHSPWISHLLLERGFEVFVGNARKLRSIWQSDQKDDMRDAEMLARIGRFDPRLLSPIHHRGLQAQADLAVIRGRDALVRARTALISSARGLVKSLGHRLPSCSADAFARKVVQHVPANLEPALAPMLASIAQLTASIQKLDRRIEELCKESYEETQQLRQIPGVGPLTSLAFVLTLEDPHRFKKNRSVGPFLGLTPKRDQSGESDKHLSISKAGNEHLRRLLTQSAHYILGPFGPDCDLRRFGEHLRERGGKAGKGRAVTAVARKLAVLLLHLWKSGDVYEPFHATSRSNARPADKAA